MVNKPKCVIITGRGGAGKTMLSKKLAQQLWMPVISRDEIKEGYVNTFGVKHDELPPDTNGIVSNFFFETVQNYLNNKVSVIIEAAFQHKVWETRMAEIGEICQPFIIVCSLDADVAAKRHLERGLADARREFYHGEVNMAQENVEQQQTLDQIRGVIDHLVQDRSVTSRLDGKRHGVFPVAVSPSEGEGLRDWVVREGATKTIEIGLGYGFSALHICEGLLMNGRVDAQHIVLDPNQVVRFSDCGLQALDDAGVRQMVEHISEGSEIVLQL